MSVAAGPRHNLAVTDRGAVYTWGDGKEGVLGHGTDESWRWGFWGRDTTEPAPRLVRSLADDGIEVESAAAGLCHSVCVDRTGHVHAWGQGRFNQLGVGAKNAPAFTTEPTRVPALGRVRDLAAGGNFNVAVGADGSMISWGANGNGELGLGNSNDKRGDVPRSQPRGGVVRVRERGVEARGGDVERRPAVDVGVERQRRSARCRR